MTPARPQTNTQNTHVQPHTPVLDKKTTHSKPELDIEEEEEKPGKEKEEEEEEEKEQEEEEEEELEQ